MIFDPYKEDAAILAADIVNTRGSITGREFLRDEAALAGFLSDHGFDPEKMPTASDLEEFRRLRDRLHRIFFASDEESTAVLLNELLIDTAAVPQLIRATDTWEVALSPPGGTLVREVAATAAMGLAALFSESGRARFGICSADDCRDVFVDTSRNRSRRYCADSCSSRTNVAAFRARKRSSRA